MVIKTLHWYILRELLRIFFLTASALTTLIAFCGTFKPLTKQSIEIMQLLSYMMNLMPAMLAYAIPIAALFAAVLVYWRLSTDNELTACRASGISFVTMVVPAFFLGFVVAVVDFGFVHYVVPVFLQRTERAVMSDLGSLLVSQVGRQEHYKIGPFVIYADAAHERKSDDPNSNSVVVVLDGMAATQIKNRRPTQFVSARQAIVTITSDETAENQATASVKLIDAAAFDPHTFDRYSGSIDSLAGGEALPIPSPIRSKPKFLNYSTLDQYLKDPTGFKPVQEIVEKIAVKYQYQVIAQRLYEKWQADSKLGTLPVKFKVPSSDSKAFDELWIYAPFAYLDGEGDLIFTKLDANPEKGFSAKPMRIEVHNAAGRHEYTYNCDKAIVRMGTSEFTKGTLVSLQLYNVTSKDLLRNIPGFAGQVKDIPALQIDPALLEVPVPPGMKLLKIAHDSKAPSMLHRYGDAYKEVLKLKNTIKSELHSRASFSISCLTLVLFGAALGILLRGKNPLAVFVMGLVPASLVVLLITAGRQMAETANVKNLPIGVSLIWAGNVILLILITAVYSKLLRH